MPKTFILVNPPFNTSEVLMSGKDGTADHVRINKLSNIKACARKQACKRKKGLEMIENLVMEGLEMMGGKIMIRS